MFSAQSFGFLEMFNTNTFDICVCKYSFCMGYTWHLSFSFFNIFSPKIILGSIETVLYGLGDNQHTSSLLSENLIVCCK